MPRSAGVRTTESLYAFSRKLAGTATLDDVLWATAYQIALMLKVRVVLLLPEDGMLTVKWRLSAGGPCLTRPISPPPTGRWEQRSPGRPRLGHAAGRQAAVPADAHRPRSRSASIGIDDDRTGPLLTPDQRRLLDALVDQGALAIERVLLVEDMDRVKRTVEIRPAARRAADLDLARPQDAAGLGARRRLDAARSRHRA